jgi:hypothetical protein
LSYFKGQTEIIPYFLGLTPGCQRQFVPGLSDSF